MNFETCSKLLEATAKDRHYVVPSKNGPEPNPLVIYFMGKALNVCVDPRIKGDEIEITGTIDDLNLQ